MIPSLVLTILPLLLSAAPIDDTEPLGGIRIPLTKRYIPATRERNIYVARSVQQYNDAMNGSEASCCSAEWMSRVKREPPGVLKLRLYQDHLWHGPVTIGSQTLPFEFDTGSSDIIVRGPGCGRGPFYDPTQSRTSQKLPQTFKSRYIDSAAASGNVYRETVTIASLKIVDQAIGIAQSTCNFYPDTAGLVGIGPLAGSDIAHPSFMQNLITQNKIAQPIVSFLFGTLGCPSEAALGFADPKWFIDPIIEVPVNSEHSWQVQLDTIIVNEEQVTGSVNAIIDTGSNMIITSEKGVAQLYSKITGYKQKTSPDGRAWFTFPCKQIPHISFVFSGHPFDVPPHVLNQGTDGDSDQCVSGIGVLPDLPGDLWIFGGLFLEHFYTSFNADPTHPSIQFATLSDAALQCTLTNLT